MFYYIAEPDCTPETIDRCTVDALCFFRAYVQGTLARTDDQFRLNRLRWSYGEIRNIVEHNRFGLSKAQVLALPSMKPEDAAAYDTQMAQLADLIQS